MGAHAPRPTRVSKRIANRLGKAIPEAEPQTVATTENDSSTSDSEPEVKQVSRKTRPARRGRKPKSIEQAPIKLTTFTVEELYRKYRPDLAGPSKPRAAKTNQVKLKEHNDDDSSGDDYLVDPAELDLNSDFFTQTQSTVAQSDSKSIISFDCNAGLEMHESGDSEEDDLPLSCLKRENTDSSEFNKKLVEQINQTNQHCMNMIKLAEISRAAQSSGTKASKQEQKVSDLLLAGEKIKMGSLSLKQANAMPVEREEKKPDRNIEITIKLDSTTLGKQQKKKVDLLTAVKRLMNREKRQNQIYLHKVSILCWIGHGTFLNRTITNPMLIQLATKRFLPSANCRPKGLTNIPYFEQIIRYFRKIVKLKNEEMYFKAPKLPPLKATLKYQILQRSAFSKRDFLLLFLLMLRCLNIHSRLVISLVVPPKQVPSDELYRMVPKTREELEADRRLLSEFQRAPKHSTVFKVKEKLEAMIKKDSAQIRRKTIGKSRYEGFSSTISQIDGSSDYVAPLARESNAKQLNACFSEMEKHVTTKMSKKPDKVETTFGDNLDEEVRRRREKILAAYRASKERKALAEAKVSKDMHRKGRSSSLKPRGRAEAKGRRNVPGVDIWIEAYCEKDDKWVTIDVLNNRVHCLEDIVVCFDCS